MGGAAVEEGGINDDAFGVNFKITSNGEGQQERECGREVKPISMLRTFKRSSKTLASGFKLKLLTFIGNFCSYDDGTPVNIAAAQPKAIGISGSSKNNYAESNVVSPFNKMKLAQSSSKPSSNQGWQVTMEDAMSNELDLLCPQRA
ncbi:hypothetical protein SLEP1_g25839 [Rubroshorea leprosula]|uniref:Uncharacterized protein n=1 Tax=Rubroshorea leprosula TaxID=152421 RepID=A0AAV5JKE0_9ROSI|nr:hypothetical protein SLEP1_g25839 [Rubroshorea leprosula]